jgi:hypothetical protein
MPRRRIISELAARPVEEIRAELADIKAEKARIDIEEQLLTQVLRLRELEADSPEAAGTVTATETSTMQRKHGNVSAGALAVVRHAEEPLRPTDVRDRLAADGVEAGMEAIRIALRRWVDRGELTKEGRYYADASKRTLLSPNGGDAEE